METQNDSMHRILDRILTGNYLLREQALAELPELSNEDRQYVSQVLISRLNRESGGRDRGWFVSALAATNMPEALAAVIQRLDAEIEPYYFARYWAVIALVRMNPPDLNARLQEIAAHDSDDLVQATALGFLVALTCEEEYIERLLHMVQSDEGYQHWAGCKGIGTAVHRMGYPEWIEGRFLPVLEQRLYDREQWREVQYQAAMALGGFKHKWMEAIKVLTAALKKDLYHVPRRACVDALGQIGRSEAQEALLIALGDQDAEIHARAANTLKQILGPTDAAKIIVDELVRADTPPPGYVDALRKIDGQEAARLLTDYLLDADPDKVDRASRVLTSLGGEGALRTLQTQRNKAMETYTQLLGSADQNIMQQFNNLMNRAHQAFSMAMWMHGIIFGVGVLILVASMYVALSQNFETFERYVGVGGAVSSVGVLLLLFYRNPLNNIRKSMTDLMQVNVVFLGYVRQINQIDATFKQLFLSAAGFDTDQMDKTVRRIQGAVKGTMQEIQTYLGQYDDKKANREPGPSPEGNE
ncbi:MAG: HEAT repeat domain-containing protein [Anaerolineae bacterium]|nr:HEAT repeat domain-containing protein [Anaerolineae bacterium]